MSLFLALCRAVDEKIAMKKSGIPITGVNLDKSGKLRKVSKTPKPLASGKHRKAARAEKAWKHPRGK
jgi:hypothetical protein